MRVARYIGDLAVRGGVYAFLVACMAVSASAQTAYYINDGSTAGNYYTSAAGDDGNDGLSESTPMRTLTNLLAVHTLSAGDIVYMDTGTYSGYTVNITVSGTSANPIIFQGAPKDGATVFDRQDSSLHVFNVSGSHLVFRNFTIRGGNRGFTVPSGSNGVLVERVIARNNQIGFYQAGSPGSVWLVRNSIIAHNSNRGARWFGPGITFDRCVFWKNTVNVHRQGGGIEVNNSVIAGESAFNTLTGIAGDYNVFWDTVLLHGQFRYLHELDMPNSTYADPEFADPAGFNFHPKSVTGRFDPSTGSTVTDAVHSVVIDFGDPASTAYTNEPAPHGSRVNAGAYGGTERASQSREDPWLHTITFNDGGNISGAGNVLRWNYGAFPAESTVYLQYSPDEGVSWSNIVTGIDVTNRMYTWDVTGLEPMAAHWRVVSHSDPSVWAQNERRFTVNGYMFPYYVNDGHVEGNVYTTEPGDDANDGLTPGTPMRTLTNLLATYTLEPGSIVYIDTGTYSNYTTTVSVSGVEGRPIVFQGAPGGGATVFRRGAGGENVFDLDYVQHVHFRDMTVMESRYGMGGPGTHGAAQGEHILVENIIFRDNANAIRARGDGWTIRNTVFTGNSGNAINAYHAAYDFLVEHCVFYDNFAALWIEHGLASQVFRNNVVVGGTAFRRNTPTADYNVFWRTDLFEGQRAYLSELNGPNSIHTDPLFADPQNLNFHPKSVTGRYDPLTGNTVTDSVHSVLIDFGDPASTAWTNEPDPNGGRVNAGAFGGTELAGRSRTSAWVRALTFSDGGGASGANTILRWNHGKFDPGETVALQFRPDGGVTWSNIATGVPVTDGVYTWDVTGVPPMAAVWRVVSESDPAVESRSVQRFSINGHKVPYYVNNDDTEDNSYTSEAGNDSHDGLTPETPMRTITNLFARYNLGGFDIVYVDTGVYSNFTLTVGPRQAGSSASGRFTLRGSTSPAGGGTVIDRMNPDHDALRVTGSHVEIEHMTLKNGLRVTIDADSVALRDVRVFDMAASGASSIVNLEFSQGVSFERCIIKGRGVGIRGNWPFTVNGNVMWSNSAAFNLVRNQALGTTISNTVVVGGNMFAGTRITQYGDYNILWNAAIGPAQYTSLNVFQKLYGWWNSAVLDPKFADPENYNFHPRSMTGRYDPDTGDFVADAEHSPLIDLGDPASTAWTNEPAPHGDRLNVGAFGGTLWASKSRTNAWLQVLTYNDGGALNVEENDIVRWTGGNFPPEATVRIELAAEPGADWQVAASGISATAGSWAWAYTNQTSTTQAMWRVVYEDDPDVSSHTASTFSFRNGPFVYYVNNHSTAGNVYTVAPGDNANRGLDPSTPKATLQAVLNAYALEPGDIIYVDTGVYTLGAAVSANPVMGITHSGSTNQYVHIRGSTNNAAGGTVFTRPGTPAAGRYGLLLDNARYVKVSDIRFRNQDEGIRLNNAEGSRLVRVHAYENNTGIRVINSPGTVLERVISRQNTQNGVLVGSGDVTLRHSVLWNNVGTALRVAGGTARMTNSVIVASTPGALGYHAANPASVVANYNNIFTRNQAMVGHIASLGRNTDSLSAWSAETGQDRASMSVDPLFADPPVDFHLKTRTPAGRYDPASGGWVADAVTSRLIDAGDPASDFSNEPPPNGGRVNIGLYGNTPEASKGRQSPWLHAASLRQGGWVKETATLSWVAGNLDVSDLVRIEISADGGESWDELHAGVPATDEYYLWDTTAIETAVAGLWRVSLVENPSGVFSETTNFFAIRNAPLAWYVNNGDMNHTLWTTAPGSPTNWVATPERPLDSLATVFHRYDIEPGDVVYVDTGMYSDHATVTIGPADSGVSGNPVVVLGSTHYSVPGSVLAFTGGVGLDVDHARYVIISNIVVEGAATGIRVRDSQHIGLSMVRAVGGSGDGLFLQRNNHIRVSRAVLADNQGFGLRGHQSDQVRVGQSIVWSNRAGGVRYSAANTVSISNSLITAAGITNRIYSLENVSGFQSDFNNLQLRDDAELALVNNLLRRFLTSWQAATGNDMHSLTHAPLLADPANGDFHLRSEAGRFDPAQNDFVLDGETSPMIDAAHPGTPYGEESFPNGGRMNMGLYGNHPEASRTPPTPRLLAVSLYGGGVIRGTNSLYWIATGGATSHTVRIQYTADDGETWVDIAVGLPAAQGVYEGWDTTVEGTFPRAFWRVISEDDASLQASNSVPFRINNSQISYYVNDGNTEGNVYTTTAGNLLHDGLDPDTPLPSLHAVMNRYDIEAGDRIYIDTGEYTFSSPVTFSAMMSGWGTNRVRIIGSTNYTAGGTVINGLKSGPAFRFRDVEAYEVSHLRFTNTARVMDLERVKDSRFEHVHIDFPTGMSSAGDRYGFRIAESQDIVMNRSSIFGLTNTVRSWALQAEESTGLLWNNGVMWYNNIGIELAANSSMAISNSIIGVFGPNRIGIRVTLGSSFTGDYNNFHARQGADPVHHVVRIAQPPHNVSLSAPLRYPDVTTWQQATGKGLNTLSHDPLFLDAQAGSFFLKSQEGRYDVSTGLFVPDAVTSPLIDAGDPAADYAHEPDPNGGRVNIGLYGNTLWASKTPDDGALTVLSFNDGGVAKGTQVNLRWLPRGAVTNDLVLIRFSGNGGASWDTVATGIPALDGVYTWNTTEWPSTLKGRWRVESQSTPVSGTNEVIFAVRNTNFVFYVNDDSLDGDVYTTAVGASGNTGLSADSPLPGLADVFQRYDVRPGDVVYVDTGEYTLSGNLVISQRDAGDGEDPVRIIGSTNRDEGGTVFTGGGLRLDATRGLTLKNITFNRVGQVGAALHVVNATNTLMKAVDVIGGGHGIHIERSMLTRMVNCSVRNVTTNALWADQSAKVVWDQGLLWSNRYAVRGFAGISVSNSVLGAFGPDAYIYFGGGLLNADYNSIHVRDDAWVARESVGGQELPNLYRRLGNWAQATGRDRHSLAQDPLFADPAVGDFHLKTQAPGGRYVPGVGFSATDEVTSPLIDAASPAAPFDQEPIPHGDRANIGRFGNTPEASHSPTNAALHAVSFYDGGTVRGTNVTFHWLAQGAALSHSVRIEFSPDNGASWDVLAAGIPADAGSFTQPLEGMPSTVLARWRVVSETEEPLSGEMPDTVVFAIRNGPVPFYVNDSSTNGNVYTTNIGLPGHTGTTPSDPKDSVRSILRTYDLEPGDLIYIDTGTYPLTRTISITSMDAGSLEANRPVTLIGSTNYAAGGTVFEAADLNPAISLTDAEYIALRHLTIRNAQVGIRLTRSRGFDFRHIRIEGAATGVSVTDGSHNGVFRHCLIRDTTGPALSLAGVTGISWGHGVLWSNAVGEAALGAVQMSGGSVSFSNSVFSHFSANAVFSWNRAADLRSDYNFFQLEGPAYISRRTYPFVPGDALRVPLPMKSRNLAEWIRDYGRDRHSLAGDPLFADPVGGDFHPLSEAGRYDPVVKTFVTDAHTSLLIDSGSPQADYSKESDPHGYRVNIGLYGNTPEASRSPAEPRLVPLTLRDGGYARGDSFRLIWRAYGAATGHTVRIDFSPDGGNTWEEIATNIVAVTEGGLFWDTTGHPSTWIGAWRVRSEDDPGVYGQTEKPFALRNDPLVLYINDGSTEGVVYTTAAGSSDGDGLTPATPRNSLQSILNEYDLEPGDVIYMDTGNYIIDQTIEWTRFNAWNNMTNLLPLFEGAAGVTLQGSTNELAGGTRITRVQNGRALELVDAWGVSIRNIRFRNEPRGSGSAIRLTRSSYASLEWITARDALIGIDINESHEVRLRHTLLQGHAESGLRSWRSENTDFQHGVFWSNAVGARVGGGSYAQDPLTRVSSLTVENSVFGALKPETAGIEREDGSDSGVLSSDYNVFHVVPGAYIGRQTGPYPGGAFPIRRLSRWNERTGQDANSLGADPKFADPDTGDFHPMSPYGRYVPGEGFVTNAMEAFSPLIDGARADAPYGHEPDPNGARANIGLYGNTPQASKSPEEGVLRVLTFSDGGSNFDDIGLHWVAAGPVTNHLVTIEFSPLGGEAGSWTNVATGVPASHGYYLWNSAPYGRAIAGVWRITSQTDTNLWSMNDNFFRLRQDGSIPYFVNHPLSNGDVYTTAPGHDNNTGWLPSAPKPSLRSLIRDNELEPGDVIYIDTGVYEENVTTRMSIFEAGTAESPVIIRGSTNMTAGGTVMDRITRVGSTLEFFETEGIRIENLSFRNANTGVRITRSDSISLSNIKSYNNVAQGVHAAGSSNVRLENVLLWNNDAVGLSLVTDEGAAVVNARHVVSWGNPVAMRVDAGCSLQISNSVLQAHQTDARIFVLGENVTAIQADYNNLVRTEGAVLAERQVDFGGNEFYPRMLDWQRFLGQDRNSLSHAPHFANPGAGDFHPMSVEGRWLSTNWVSDAVHSPLIDTGSPYSPWDREQEPHGERVNIGFYGHTPYASLSKTNAWLLAVSVNDGGVVFGTQRLYWVAGNMDPSETVTVEFSSDGISYVPLKSGIPVYESEFMWDASNVPITQHARWRVVSDEDPDLRDTVDMPFTVKNETIVVYVNDGNTNNTVYTTAPGHSDNDGLSPNQPMNNPARAIQEHPFGPGDILYIDTGEYIIADTDGMRLGLIGDTLKSGQPGWPIIIMGSTNFAAGGSRFVGMGHNAALVTLIAARDVHVHNLDLRQAQRGVRVVNAQEIKLDYVSAHGTTFGFDFNNARNIKLSRAASYNNAQWGYRVAGAQSIVDILSSVAWGNQLGAVSLGSGTRAVVRHSILDASLLHALAYSVHEQASISGDYNMIWPGGNTRLARNPFMLVDYRSLRAWQDARNMDHHSVVAPPLFADPASGNFRLRSQKGRFNLETGVHEPDAETSWAIDAGDRDAPYDHEPEPHGGRLNIGRYGNTAQASLSVTNRLNADLKVVSMRDGGTVSFTHPLYWLHRGLDEHETVRLEYSPNDGATWITIATNVPVADQTHFWDFSEEESTPLGLWRIELESDPSLQDQTPQNFTIRNGPITYFVNDTNTVGDVYAAAPGHATNDGITVWTPVDRISAIIERYDLDQGDTIYVDTGIYEIDQNILILANDSGVATNRVVIQGSTNHLAGGTVLHRVRHGNFSMAGEPAVIFDLYGVRFLEFRDLIMQNADIAIRMGGPTSRTTGHLLKNLLIRDGGRAGVSISESAGNRFERVVITRHYGSGISMVSGAGNTWINSSILWSNRLNAINVEGTLNISNSVLHAMAAPTNVIYNVPSGSNVRSDYNALFADRGASYARRAGFLFSGLPQWNQETLQDRRSISGDPLFADPANDDYHLLSEVGRYVRGEGWVTNDTVTSFLIDTGSPQSDYSMEPEPHGGRRNIGLYGNTAEASKSLTREWLLAITALQGGRMNGIIQLYWAFGNLDATNRVRLEYSLEMGENWQPIAENVPIDQDGFFWDSTDPDVLISPISQWRVILEADTNLYHTADTFFGLNGPFTFYVNDHSVENNVFTEAPGDDEAFGIFPTAPKATLKSVFDDWDLEPEDRILIDTGIYYFDTNNLVTITIDSQGAAGRPVTIRGSTNAPGTLLDATALGGAVFLNITAGHMLLEDMAVRHGAVRAAGTNIVFRDMQFSNTSLRIAGAAGQARNIRMIDGSLEITGNDVYAGGVEIRDGTLTVGGARALLEHSVISRGAGTLVTVSGTNTVIRNNTVVGGGVAVRQRGSGSSLDLFNNILIANSQIIQRDAGTLSSDYNLLLARGNAWIGNTAEGLWERLVYWQERSGQDLNSISADPLFADEAGGDYHLKSSAGRYFEGIWMTDLQNSPAIDAGNPGSAFGHELDPNGGRINLGAYGNTEQASKTSASPWLGTMSLNDGGAVRGTNVVLRWLARGAGMDEETVTLQYRPDPSGGWITIVSGLPAAAGSYTWDTTQFESSLFAKWRVVLDSNPGVYYGETDNEFSVRNDPQDFFVNNGVFHDIYTTAPGSPANDGLTPATPKSSIQDLLDTYDTVGGDVIYVDTGTYTVGDTEIIWSRGGDAEHGPMVIQGSTNLALGGTVLRRGNTVIGRGFNVLAAHVTLRDLSIHTAQRGVWLNSTRDVKVERVFSYSNTVGILAGNSRNVELRNLRVWKNLGGIDLSNVRTARVENVTFVANSNYSFRAQNTILNTKLQNNIFVVSGSNDVALSGSEIPSDEMFIDYNIYYFEEDGYIFGTNRNLRTWQLSQHYDFRSAITNPRMQNASAGNFHLRSEYGRYDPSLNTFVEDVETSWAIGRGNPDSPFDRQPDPTAGRVNLGAFGNTEFASKGSTNIRVVTRTLNAPGQEIGTLDELLQPLVWAVNNLPEGVLVAVQFSGDGGVSWHTIEENVDAYQEYIIWTTDPYFNTFDGRWRVIGMHEDDVYAATNTAPIEIRFSEFEDIVEQFLTSERHTIMWHGAWHETYRVEYTEDGINWVDAPDGPGSHQKGRFTSTRGGDLYYEDIESPDNRFRSYRVIWEVD